MKYLIFTLTIFFCLPGLAEVDQQALKKTQDVINDASKRDANINAVSPQAKQAMQMLRSMGMTKQQEDALMGIAADSLGDMLKNTNGDTSKLKDQLAKGLSNPETFLKNMSSDSRNRIRDLSGQVEGQNKNERK